MNTLRNELKRSYSQIPNELITDLSISAGALRVLLYLFTKPDDWSVYNADICKNLNIHSETLSKYWKELLASKWLRRTEKRDKGLFVGYEYSIGEFDHTDNLPIRENTDTVKNGDGKNPAHNNNKPTLTIKDTKTKENMQKKPAFVLPSCINPEEWAKWIAYRKDRRLTCTDKTLSGQIANLTKWAGRGHSPAEIIKHSIDNGYQGLFEPKGYKQSGVSDRNNINAKFANMEEGEIEL